MFCAVPVIADYSGVGGPGGKFVSDNGRMTVGTDTTTDSFPVTDTVGIPVYADMDSDGWDEIAVTTGSVWYVFNRTGGQLNVEYSSNLNNTATSAPAFFDLDDDGTDELVIPTNTGAEVFGHNGTAYVRQADISTSTSCGTSEDPWRCMMGCGHGDCYIFRQEPTNDHEDVKVHISRFNATAEVKNNGSRVGLNSDYGTEPGMVFSQPQGVRFADITADNQPDIGIGVIGWGGYGGSHGDYVIGSYGLLFDPDTCGLENTIVAESLKGEVYDDNGNDEIEDELINNERIHRRYHVMFGDGDGVESNGDELITSGYDETGRLANSYTVTIHDRTGSRLRQMPATTSLLTIASGDQTSIVTSNMVNSDIFPDTGDNDICYMVYHATDIEENGTVSNSSDEGIFCASYTTGAYYDWHMFLITDPIDITYGYDPYTSVLHAADMNDAPSSFQGTTRNVDEIITHHGVVELLWGTDHPDISSLAPIHSADLTVDVPVTFGSTVTMNTEDNKYADLFLLTSEYLYVVDDGFVNEGPGIDAYTVNPCVESPWLLNGTVRTSVTPLDAENDLVQARSVLYEGRAYEQDSNWSAEYSSGQEIAFFHEANHTVTEGKLSLYVRDTVNPEKVASITMSFSVTSDGVEYGECVTDESGLVTPVEEEEEEEEAVPGGKTESAEDNSINNALNELKGDSGLSSMVLWIIIMAVVAGSIIFYLPGSMTHNHMFALIGIVEVFLLILGAHLGFISTGVIVVLVILALGAGAMWFRRQFTGSYN